MTSASSFPPGKPKSKKPRLSAHLAVLPLPPSERARPFRKAVLTAIAYALTRTLNSRARPAGALSESLAQSWEGMTPRQRHDLILERVRYLETQSDATIAVYLTGVGMDFGPLHPPDAYDPRARNAFVADVVPPQEYGPALTVLKRRATLVLGAPITRDFVSWRQDEVTSFCRAGSDPSTAMAWAWARAGAHFSAITLSGSLHERTAAYDSYIRSMI